MLLAVAAAVSIFVGPHVKNGFIQADQDVMDSIKDVQKRLRKDAALRVVDREADASVRLRILYRGSAPTGGSVTINTPGTSTLYPGQVLTFPHGGTIQLPGTIITTPGVGLTVPNEKFYIVSVAHVGEHEQPIIASCELRSRCAKHLAKQVSAWVTANRERIEAKE